MAKQKTESDKVALGLKKRLDVLTTDLKANDTANADMCKKLLKLLKNTPLEQHLQKMQEKVMFSIEDWNLLQEELTRQFDVVKKRLCKVRPAEDVREAIKTLPQNASIQCLFVINYIFG